MATKKVRNDGMAPEELQAAIEAYKARKNERKTTGMELGNSHQDLPNAVPNEKKQDQSEVEEAIQTVKDRRDRRDAQEDPKETSEAMSVIAQQDEDIDNLLQTISKLLAQKDFDAAEGQKAVDNESGPTDAKSEESKTEGLNMDSADHLIRSRLEVARLGDKLHLDGLEALPLHEAKKRIILAVRPEIRLDGKDSAYIRAAYDIAREEVNRRKDINHQRAQMFNPIIARMDGSTSKSAALTARERMIQKLRGEND